MDASLIQIDGILGQSLCSQYVLCIYMLLTVEDNVEHLWYFYIILAFVSTLYNYSFTSIIYSILLILRFWIRILLLCSSNFYLSENKCVTGSFSTLTCVSFRNVVTLSTSLIRRYIQCHKDRVRKFKLVMVKNNAKNIIIFNAIFFFNFKYYFMYVYIPRSISFFFNVAEEEINYVLWQFDPIRRSWNVPKSRLCMSLREFGRIPLLDNRKNYFRSRNI